MSLKRVVMIGGQPNGKILLDYFLSNKNVEVPLLITHPKGTDRPRFIDLTEEKGVGRIIPDEDANTHIQAVKDLEPDFLFVTGWSGLLNKELIEVPKEGTIGFHPSFLPKDRGRSVLAWQIEEGYERTALSMFYMDEGADRGDLIAQEVIPIEWNDRVSDLQKKMDASFENLIKAYFPLLRKGEAPRIEQKEEKATYRRLRTEKDSWIEWNRNMKPIFNKVRAITRPYPGAKTRVKGKECLVWEVEMVEEFPLGEEQNPGSLLATFYDGSLLFRCKDGFIRVLEYEELP